MISGTLHNKIEENNQGFVDLVQGIRHYQAGNFDAARDSWLPLKRDEPTVEDIFARSLLSNLSSAQQDKLNIYDSAAPIPVSERQIDLFEQLGRLSFFRLAQSLAIAAHSQADLRQGTHLELGIGNGRHSLALAQASKGRILRVVGVDLDSASVEQSRKLFESAGIEFIGLACSFETIDWERIRKIAGGAPVSVNASFALHHLLLEAKLTVLDEVAGLRPQLFTLVEPSSAHWQADLLSRFMSCYMHFDSIGRAINASQVDAEARPGLLEFFRREIQDVMRDSASRFERHELWHFWYQELFKRDLVAQDLRPQLKPLVEQDLQVNLPGPGVVNILTEAVHILSVFSFACQDARRG